MNTIRKSIYKIHKISKHNQNDKKCHNVITDQLIFTWVLINLHNKMSHNDVKTITKNDTDNKTVFNSKHTFNL